MSQENNYALKKLGKISTNKEFIDIMNTSFNIEKILFLFGKYEDSTNLQSFYVSFSEIDYLYELLVSDRFMKMLDAEKGRMIKEYEQTKNTVYSKRSLYQLNGGTPAERLKNKRSDGKAEARTLEISHAAYRPKTLNDLVITLKVGPGKQSDKGLIQFDGKPDIVYRIPTTRKDFVKIIMNARRHIDLFMRIKYYPYYNNMINEHQSK